MHEILESLLSGGFVLGEHRKPTGPYGGVKRATLRRDECRNSKYPTRPPQGDRERARRRGAS